MQCDSPIKKFDGRASIYFEKLNNDESDTSVYFMKPECARDIDDLNESFVAKRSIPSVYKKRSSTNLTTHIIDFEKRNEPEAEKQLREYLKLMFCKTKNIAKEQKYETKEFQLTVVEVSSENSSPEADTDQYEDGNIDESENESPGLNIHILNTDEYLHLEAPKEDKKIQSPINPDSSKDPSFK